MGVLTAGVVAVTIVAMPPAASAGSVKRSGRLAPEVQRVLAAVASVGKIPPSRYARGRRAALLRASARAARLARRGQACGALAAVDTVLTGLRSPRTWRHRRIPGRFVQAPTGKLSAAESALIRRTGPKCARGARRTSLSPHRGGAGAPKVKPPVTQPDQGEGDFPAVPQGKLRELRTLPAPITVRPDPHNPGNTGAADRPFANAAGDPLTFFRNSDAGTPPRGGSPQEPTAAIGSGGVGWYTGNSSVALSTDNGRTWTMWDPSNVLPDQGMSFCCDQLVSYSPQYDLFVWISQYWCTGGNGPGTCDTDPSTGKKVGCRTDGAYNRIRVAVASPSDLRANASNPGRAWTYWDVTPGTVGEPAGAWFDRSDLSVNPVYMNWGVDIPCGAKDHVTLLSRISLAELAARGTVTLSYLIDGFSRTAAQGLGTSSTYFAGDDSLSEALIWSWEAGSNLAFRHDIGHTTVPILDRSVKASDGGDWYDRFGIFPGEVESATVSGNTLYLAQGTGRSYQGPFGGTLKIFDEPAIYISKFDLTSWRLVDELWLSSPTNAIGWPALQTDAAGDVGIAFRWSKEGQNPQPVAGFLTPEPQFTVAEPAGGPFQTGDYYSLRPGRTSRSFVMTGEVRQPDPSTPSVFTNHWFSIEYGHGAAPSVRPPSVHITSPASLSTYPQGTSVDYSAAVSDPVDGTLPAEAITWTEDGSVIGSGREVSNVENAPGTHVVTVTATNGEGQSASDMVTIRVQPSHTPIIVHITSPADGSTFAPSRSDYNSALGEYCTDVKFTADASEGSGPLAFSLTYSWSDMQDGISRGEVSTELSPTLSLCAPPYTTSHHDLSLTASDGRQSSSAAIRVNIRAPAIQ